MGDEFETRVQQFVRDSNAILEPYLNTKYGLVLYSHKSTLRSNPVLFYGFNPGCEPSREHEIRWTIGQSLDYFSDGFDILKKRPSSDLIKSLRSERLHEECNLIDDQCWPFPSFVDNYPMGQAPYQKNTRNLLRAIGHPGALITNLLFLQSAKPTDIPKDQRFEDACWRVHELIFKITKPSLIVTCSTVLDRGLRRNLSLKLVPPPLDSGYGPPKGKWKCKQWEGKWRDEAMKDRRIVVCQIPHMSYYDIAADYSKKKGVAEWARGVLQDATKARPPQRHVGGVIESAPKAVQV